MARTIPDNIMNELSVVFANRVDDFARVIFFLTKSLADEVGAPYTRALGSVLHNQQLFKRVAERYSDDTRKAENDGEYRQFMDAFWRNFWNGALPQQPVSGRQMCTPTESFFKVLCTHSTELLKVNGLAHAVQTWGLNTTAPLAGLVLSFDIMQNIIRWFNGEISEKRCIKNIMECGLSLTAGVMVTAGGAALGGKIGCVLGPWGCAAGALIGGICTSVVASVGTQALCEELLEKFFPSSRREAVERAYRILGVSRDATNHDINRRFRSLLQQHTQANDSNMWTNLQFAMAIIKTARAGL